MTSPPGKRGFLFGLLLAAAAGYGLAVFLAVFPRFVDPAPAGQVASYMTAKGLDAHGPFRAMVALILFPGIAALTARPLAVRFAARDAAPWAGWLAAGSLFAALWAQLLGSTSVTLLIGSALAAAGLLLVRRLPITFSALDTLLIPAFVVVYFALLDIRPGMQYPKAVLVSLGAVLFLRLGLGALEKADQIPAAWCFCLAPAAHVLQIQLLQRERVWPSVLALAIVLGSPVVLRLSVRWNAAAARRFRLVLVYLTLPLFALAYPNSRTMTGYEGEFRVNFFEDGHQLLPASEMLLGERLYRDVVPGHGMIADGGFDWLAMRLFGARIDVALAARHAVSSLNAVAVYALGLAATGSPPAALLTLLFSSQMISFGLPWMRSAPAFAALAFAMAAARRREPRRLAGAGAFLVLSLLTSVEIGVYTGAVLLLAVARFGDRRARLRALRWSAAGALAVGLPAAVFFLVHGVLDDFLRVTLFEVLSLGPAYALGFDWAPPALRAHAILPEALLTLFDSAVFEFLLWLVVTLATAAGLAASPLRMRRRTEPLWLLGGWVALAGLSFAERHHDYFIYGLAPFLAIAAFLLWRARSPATRACGAVLLVALVAVSRPTEYFGIAPWLRGGPASPEPGWVEVTSLPRARGALFPRDEAAKLEAAREFVQKGLGPGETFYDFVNLPILYFLFDRSCPVRQYEVPFYESEEGQREVIARLESDHTVRAVLMSFGTFSGGPIDGVPNAERVPLVWEWIQKHFQPGYSRDGVVFWVRTIG
jgi:hypothetical protein